jgi:RimJ/RimL family protein N-acetyltransferase
MEFVTARLRIDDLRDEDAAALYGYRSDPAVARYQRWHPGSVGDAESFIATQRHVVVDTPDTWWQRAIRLRDSMELIGDLGLHFTAEADATTELGVSIAPGHQGHGYAREALEMILDFAFGGLHKHRVFASVDPRNQSAVKLLEGLGMRREAHFRESVRCDDGWADDLVFGLLSREWLAPTPGGSG